MSLRVTQKIGVAAWSTSVLFVAIALLGAYESRRLVGDAAWVEHSRTVQSELHTVAEGLGAAKADVRGFLLTGDSSYLSGFDGSVALAESAFERVKDLTADNPDQQARVARLRDLLTQREGAHQQTIGLRSRASLNQTTMSERLAIGERLSLSIDSTLAAADSAEARLHAVRERRAIVSGRLQEGTAAALVVIGLALAFLLARSITRDVRSRAEIEEQLRASEAKFSGILEIAADAVITVDDRQRIVHFNHAAETIFGYERAEMLGQPLDLLLPDRHRHAHGSHLRTFATSPEVSRRMGERREIHGRRKDGREFPAEASISKLMTPNGWVFTAVLRDVTETRREELRVHTLSVAGSRLAQSLDFEATIAAVAELPVPAVGAWAWLDIIESTDEGRSVLRRIIPRHPDPDVDRALREWERFPVHWDSPEAVIDVLRTGELQLLPAVSDDWLEAHTEDPRQLEMARRLGAHSLLLVPLARGGRVVGAWTIGASVEHSFDEHDRALAVALAERATLAIEHARLFRDALRATTARDQVLSIVSHDLRNPLVAVSMLARRLVEGPLSESARASIGADILTSVDWMHRLMQDLLDVASIQAGRLSVESEPAVLYQVAEAAIGMFAHHAASVGVTLSNEVSTSLPLVYADTSRIVQVLANLVSNALRFTPRGGSVTIGAAAQDDRVTVWVRDTGLGIPESDLPHVFDRFWHARRGAESRGHGLGLAIADGIARAHGGQMWVESVLGQGTAFFFTLGVVRRHGTPSLPGGDEAGLPTGERVGAKA